MVPNMTIKNNTERFVDRLVFGTAKSMKLARINKIACEVTVFSE